MVVRDSVLLLWRVRDVPLFFLFLLFSRVRESVKSFIHIHFSVPRDLYHITIAFCDCARRKDQQKDTDDERKSFFSSRRFRFIRAVVETKEIKYSCARKIFLLSRHYRTHHKV